MKPTNILQVIVLLMLLLISNIAFSQPIGKHTAKSVIFVFLDGGPAQTDMFDPKPKAGKDYFGNYNKPITTNIAGIEIGEKLPLLAKIADKYCLIRSMTHGINAHETASYSMETGSLSGPAAMDYSVLKSPQQETLSPDSPVIRYWSHSVFNQ